MIGTKGQRPGFTLIELLIVIAIISILIVILVVGVNIPRADVRTKKVMQSIQQAMQSYSQMYGAFPPSDDKIGSGAQCLYYYLMGPRGQGWGPHKADGGVPASKRWGPAKELDQAHMTVTIDGRKAFTDGISEPEHVLLYYRADKSLLNGKVKRVKHSDIYNPKDNEAHWKPTSEEWLALVVNKHSIGDAPYNPVTYLLIGPGADEEFGDVEGHCDDITNAKRAN